MHVGIVGIQGSGKTTIFNALTGQTAHTGASGHGKAHLGMIKVPDPRIDFLCEVHKPKKRTLAEIGFVDIAGAEEFDSKTAQAVRDVDAMALVVRGFAAPGMEAPQPSKDFSDFDAETVLSDLVLIDNRLQRIKKEGGKGSTEKIFLERLHGHLEDGHPLRTLGLGEPERRQLSGYQFLTLKPALALLNVADSDVRADVPAALAEAAGARGVPVMVMAAAVEAEIAQLDTADQRAFLDDLGLQECARDRFVRRMYCELDLISFLTGGPDECRAWTIKLGTKAREAGGKIHSDIERGFIRAEVIAFEDFKAYPSDAACREHGKLRLEGKEYLVRDGDIINFRFNV